MPIKENMIIKKSFEKTIKAYDSGEINLVKNHNNDKLTNKNLY